MMEEWMLGPTPSDEDCAQVGDLDYRSRARKEMTVYVNQLARTFPDAIDKGISFRPRFFSHDFGSYGEVCMSFDDTDEEVFELARFIDMNVPENWDAGALEELNDAF